MKTLRKRAMSAQNENEKLHKHLPNENKEIQQLKIDLAVLQK